ncbi:MAG: hypothetical protein KDE19_15360 [Caldilineaceae bacterium]|nr:hypothetical protein [Caldilineaceae bacterium]
MHETGSSQARDFAQFMVVAGLILLVTPIWFLGAAFLLVGLFVWPVTHAVEPVEQRALDAAKENGGGCGWLFVVALMIVVAGMAFVVVAGAALGVGV